MTTPLMSRVKQLAADRDIAFVGTFMAGAQALLTELSRASEGHREFWIDDLDTRHCGPWSEIKELSWPDCEKALHVVEVSALLAARAARTVIEAKYIEQSEKYAEAADKYLSLTTDFIAATTARESAEARVKKLESALNEVAAFHGKCMMGPTDEVCCEIYEKNEGFDCYRRAFELGSYNAWAECVQIAKEALSSEEQP